MTKQRRYTIDEIDLLRKVSYNRNLPSSDGGGGYLVGSSEAFFKRLDDTVEREVRTWMLASIDPLEIEDARKVRACAVCTICSKSDSMVYETMTNAPLFCARCYPDPAASPDTEGLK